MYQTKILKVAHDSGRPAAKGNAALFEVAEGSRQGMRGTLRELEMFVGATYLDESCFVSYETGRIIKYEIVEGDVVKKEESLIRKVKV